jgi:hypothetical protein
MTKDSGRRQARKMSMVASRASTPWYTRGHRDTVTSGYTLVSSGTPSTERVSIGECPKDKERATLGECPKKGERASQREGHQSRERATGLECPKVRKRT